MEFISAWTNSPAAAPGDEPDATVGPPLVRSLSSSVKVLDESVAKPSAADSSAVAAPTFTADEKALLEAPVPFAEYGEVHERALSYLRWRRDEACAAEPNLEPSLEATRDSRVST